MEYLKFLLSQLFLFIEIKVYLKFLHIVKCEAIQLKVRLGAIVHHYTKLISKECSLIC